MERTTSVAREFLGWDQMPLDAAALWLLQEFGPDLSEVVVALPGARSGRLLQDLLAMAGKKELRPPEIVTAGGLSDRLLELEGVPASRLARTVVWARALQSLDPSLLRRVVARPPRDDDLEAWWSLAEEVRGLFGEVAAEGLQFACIAEDQTLLDDGVPREGERQRWRALAAAQAAMVAELARLELHDPHVCRLEAIERKRTAKIGHIVMIGVVEANDLLRRALELSDATCTALIFAPEDLADTFDECGCLISAKWAERDVSLGIEQWRVADRPAQQAALARDEIASWNGEFSAEQISIGLGNTDVGPFVKRRLGQDSIIVRDAAGESLQDSDPARLLSLLGRFLKSRRFLDMADLLRHPDFEESLTGGLGSLDPVATLDAYFNSHYPEVVDGIWFANKRDRWDVDLRKQMETVWLAVEQQLGELWGSSVQDAAGAVALLRIFLESLYADQAFDLEQESGRRNFSALKAIGTGFAEIEALPPGCLPNCSVSLVLNLLSRSLQGSYLPPPVPTTGVHTIEMLGWLELPLDNAPALVVVGFEDGHVPQSIRGDTFLPNQLRSSLDLVDDEQRLARDMYATELLLHSRDKLVFITGRQSLEGDPLLPSRIVFHCPEKEVPARVHRFIVGSPPPPPNEVEGSLGSRLPGSSEGFVLDKMSVTDFKTYLKSPYEYFLRRVIRAKSLDDRGRELDGLSFGNLAHEVVERFGRNERLRDSKDPEVIAKCLRGELHAVGREIFGARPLPSIRLQLEHLDFRLQSFARCQAAQREQGWRIHAVEWEPEGQGIEFSVDDVPIRLRGRIDRIDVHEETGRFAVWDYKTGNTVVAPATAHRSQDGTWRDLQLPLYCLLMAELTGDHPPQELGYIALCQDPSKIGFKTLDPHWKVGKFKFDGLEEGLEDAMERAHEVVREIRKAQFFVRDGFDPGQGDPIMRAIGGLDLVEEDSEQGEEKSA